ncbi:MAG: cyclophilin-like fold protein [Candidatus Omnitrophota bacterium]|nr:hypothetical protein [Candidatus Omnitrophota bacterium]MBU1929767.1 hypothetical protein [Candidatus Omnitrophota bacterium]MBU2035231.1 hypothetical protein [Candidatus Omnitrophota bacterium]MBU2258390.1 hypothetical protein [Candidatus Omnitrophota bacterium]
MLISFQTQNYFFIVQLNQSHTAREISRNIPLDSEILTWGNELHFKTGINIPESEDKLTNDVNVGDVAYWPEGSCICVFYGPTPFSKSPKPIPASPVVIIGNTYANPDELRKVRESESIQVRPIEENSAIKNTDPKDERKLTQQEIDILVQKLLKIKFSKNTNR